jgi:hypothetical protein
MMKDIVSHNNTGTPILFPKDPELFLESIRSIIREEVENSNLKKFTLRDDTPG